MRGKLEDIWLTTVSTYDTGGAVGDLAETMNAITDRPRDFKARLSVSWDVATPWRLLAPFGHHWPLPVLCTRASITLVVAWEGFDVLAILLVGFVVCSRPIEFLRLQCMDFVFRDES